MKLRLIHIVIFLLPFSLYGQDKNSSLEIKLGNLFTRLMSIGDDNTRLVMNDSISNLLKEYAGSDDIFNHSFSGLKYLGQITSPDSLLKIISWNIVLDNFNGLYSTYLIHKTDNGHNKVIYLTAPYSNTPSSEDTTYTARDWYGALYYGIKPVKLSKEKNWIVLGLDYGNPLITRKLIDVITFDDKDSVVFGRKWFETANGMKYRRVFEYAATGMMTLRFSSDTSIVFDHLVPITPATNDNQVFYGPDYSFDSYIFNSGVWEFKLNVDARNN